MNIDKNQAFIYVGLLALMATLWGEICRAEQYVLVRDGVSNARIQYNPTPENLEFRATMELQNYLAAISGATIERTNYAGTLYRLNQDAPDTVEILVCTLENGRSLLPDDCREFLEKSEYEDAYCLATETAENGWKTLYIAGKTEAGTLYGTYAFLEDYIGCRFFHALEGGEVVPAQKTIELGDIRDFRQPWVRNRIVSDGNGKELAPCSMEEFAAYLAKRSFSSQTYQFCRENRTRQQLDDGGLSNMITEGGGHGMFEQAVPPNLFETHPEYFPMKDGVRQKGTNTWQRCLANPEVFDRIVDFALRFLSYPRTSYNIMFADSDQGWCECPECQKMGIGDNGEFKATNRAHRYITKVADAILAKNPEARLQFFSYWDYEEIPDVADLHYDSRLINVFCPFTRRCVAHSLHAPCNDFSRQEFAAWSRKTPKMGLFEYYCYSGGLYAPFESTLAEDLEFYRTTAGGKLEYWIDDCTNKSPIPHLNWVFYYVASKLMWQPELKTDAILEDIWDKYYGKVASVMKEYQALRRDVWAANPEKTGHSRCFSPNRIAACLDEIPGARERLSALLLQAVEQAQGDAMLLKRLSYDQDYLKRFWLDVE